MAELELVELPAGTTLDDPMGWVFQTMSEVESANLLLEHGNDDLAWSPKELAVDFNDTAYAGRQAAILVDRADPRKALGRAWVYCPLSDNTHRISLAVTVHPELRRRGFGTRLLAWAEEQARAAGRTVYHAELSLGPRAAQGPQTPAPEGGSVAADTPGLVFAQRHGYGLEQIERMSALPVPLDPQWLSQTEDESARRAGDYRLLLWVGDVPAPWRAGLAAMWSAFLAEAPTAAMDVEPEIWDEQRVVNMTRTASEQDTTVLFAVVEHVPTRTLVAGTNLFCPDEAQRGRPSECVFQGFTLVLPGHRGHGLGRWIKVANLRQLARLYPAVRRVYTWNASENEHMLAINVELGFRAQGCNVALQKRV